MAWGIHSVQLMEGGTALPLLGDPQTAPGTTCWQGLGASDALKESRGHREEQKGAAAPEGLTRHQEGSGSVW